MAVLPQGAWAGDDHSIPPTPAVAAVTAPSKPETPAAPAASAVASLPVAPSPSTTSPDGSVLPSPPLAIVTLKRLPQPHRFFDARNSFGLVAMAATLSADAVSTQQGLAYPRFHEMNPIARPFVQTRAGGAIYSAGSFAVLAGAMYVAHKKGRHKLERILPFAIAGWEGWLSARNYHVIAVNRR
jgi:hypothetical protein